MRRAFANFQNTRQFCVTASSKVEPLIMVHGGVGTIFNDLVLNKLQGVKDAARAGYKGLVRGGAVEAVEQAIISMDMNENLNTGRGSSLTLEGQIEMSSCIMTGDLRAGAVACINNFENPIRVARLIMEKTKCFALTSKSVVEFAQKHGIQPIPTEQLITAQARELLEKRVKYGITPMGSVGVVALDAQGNLAAGTSSGGTVGRLPGRAGDCCRIGCSIYADNQVAAVAVTGDASGIIKTCLAFTIKENIEHGLSPQESIQKGLSFMDMRMQACGGAILLTHKGAIGFDFSSLRMPWAYHNATSLHYGCEKGEHNVEDADI